MKWLVELIKKIFSKRKVKLIETTQPIVNHEEKNRNNFVVMLKQTADLENDDGNGYKIIKNIKLEDMI